MANILNVKKKSKRNVCSLTLNISIKKYIFQLFTYDLSFWNNLRLNEKVAEIMWRVPLSFLLVFPNVLLNKMVKIRKLTLIQSY